MTRIAQRRFRMLFMTEARAVLRLALMSALPTEEVVAEVRTVLAEIRRAAPAAEIEERRKRFLAVALRHRPDLERWFTLIDSPPAPTRELCHLRAEDAKALRHVISLHLKATLSGADVRVEYDSSGSLLDLTVRVHRAVTRPNIGHREEVASLSISVLEARGFRVDRVTVTLHYTLAPFPWVAMPAEDDVIH